jgi:hypothetical protein
MNYYSTWNGSGYDIYRSESSPIPSSVFSVNLSGMNLGADPNTLLGSLPIDAVNEGTSEYAVGSIVNGEAGVGSMLKYVAIAAVLYYFFK